MTDEYAELCNETRLSREGRGDVSDGKLHVFELDWSETWVVARDAEDAWAVYFDTASVDATRKEIEADGYTFEQCPDDKVMSILCDHEGKISDSGDTISRTCEHWAEHEGRGFLATRNY